MGFDPSLKKLLQKVSGKTDCPTFIKVSKSDHQFAIEFCARLLRFTVNHHGPVKRKEINGWLRRDAVAEFQTLLGDQFATLDAAEAQAGASGRRIAAREALQRRIKTPNGRTEIEEMFGLPSNGDGTLNEAWEGSNIRKVAPPDKWRLYYQDDRHGLVPVSGVRMHKFLEDVFIAALDDIWEHAGREIGGGPSDDTIREWLHEKRLDQHGGGFNYRKITGGSKLSLHSYGIAIDWDPDHNPRKKPLTRTLPDWWYDIWTKQGWADGRKFSTPDPMHVQFATGLSNSPTFRGRDHARAGTPPLRAPNDCVVAQAEASGSCRPHPPRVNGPLLEIEEILAAPLAASAQDPGAPQSMRKPLSTF